MSGSNKFDVFGVELEVGDIVWLRRFDRHPSEIARIIDIKGKAIFFQLKDHTGEFHPYIAKYSGGRFAISLKHRKDRNV